MNKIKIPPLYRHTMTMLKGNKWLNSICSFYKQYTKEKYIPMKDLKKLLKTILATQIMFMLFTCSDNPTENNDCPEMMSDIVIVPPAAYGNPIWHPAGKFVGFNHTPLDSITYPYGENCYGIYHFSYDSTGFWLINEDGTDQRKILPYQLFLADWSPNGDWIAFVINAQIFKMPFNISEEKFDTTLIQQLTFEGRNFFPALSPDGEWITYDNTICGSISEPPPPNSCGVLIMNKDGQAKRFISKYSRMPDWHPQEQKVIFINRAVIDGGEVIGDSLWEYHLIHNERKFITLITGVNYDNRYPKYSVNGDKIAFTSRPNGGHSQLWIMDLTNKKYRQLTVRGASNDLFSWSPDGLKIVYTQYNYNDWSYDNGVLWTIDVNNGLEHELTYNTH